MSSSWSGTQYSQVVARHGSNQVYHRSSITRRAWLQFLADILQSIWDFESWFNRKNLHHRGERWGTFRWVLPLFQTTNPPYRSSGYSCIHSRRQNNCVKWYEVGWCVGTITGHNPDKRHKVNGQVMNFNVLYQSDGVIAKHALSLVRYHHEAQGLLITSIAFCLKQNAEYEVFTCGSLHVLER
jgi:hypothetical protein